MFHWVRNVLRKMSDEDKADFRLLQSDAFAFFWNLLKHRLPRVILESWQNWMKAEMIPAMNPNWETHADNQGSYEVKIGDKVLKYNNVQLAPPTAVMAQNYAR